LAGSVHKGGLSMEGALLGGAGARPLVLVVLGSYARGRAPARNRDRMGAQR